MSTIAERKRDAIYTESPALEVCGNCTQFKSELKDPSNIWKGENFRCNKLEGKINKTGCCMHFEFSDKAKRLSSEWNARCLAARARRDVPKD